MAKKKGAGGKPQAYDSSGKYVADYTAIGTQELRERQIIELPESEAHPPIEKAFGFHRLDTKHHQRHAREMGFKNMKEYELAAVEFFNSDKGKLYYSQARKRFYRYDEKSGKFVSSGEGMIYTFYFLRPKQFEVKVKSDECIEY